MSDQQAPQLHENDRRDHATRLGLSLEEFDRLVASANHAYEVIKDLGPFYGREDNKEPTFRITAEPVTLPEGSAKLLTDLGNDILHLAKALQGLPEDVKHKLADNLNFDIPPTWRVDIILDENGGLRLNEIEGQDGASALIIAEQLAYNLQTLEESTAAKFITALRAMCHKNDNEPCTIAHIRIDNPHNTNADRFIQFVDKLANGTLTIEHINENHIINGERKLDWDNYDGIILEPSFSPEEFYKLGLPKEKILANGIYNAIVNKGVFALLFDDTLAAYWEKELGAERFERMKKLFIPTSFVKTVEDLKKAREAGRVVKVSWAGEKAHLVNRSKGVAMPIKEDLDHGSEERWQLLEDLVKDGVRIIAQDLVLPGKIKAFLRKKGITLEPVEWYNRVCVKYVLEGDPKADQLPGVALAATEVTLGPDVIPAGRACAFTAGKLR